jgi:hypothetical protein
MFNATSSSDFNVNIMVQVAGQIRPRTKYIKHKLLCVERNIKLLLRHILGAITRSYECGVGEGGILHRHN